MGIVGVGLFFAFLFWLMERRNSPLGDQPCWKCGKTVHWIGLPTGWIHKATGRTWEPCTFAEWDGSPPTPHPASRAWDPSW